MTDAPAQGPVVVSVVTEVSGAHSAMQLQQALREHFAEDERPLFAVTGKSHLVVHPMISAAYMHPRLSWCYRGEDFMRVWQRLGQNSTRGRTAIQAMKAMSDHLSIGMRLDWKAASHTHSFWRFRRAPQHQALHMPKKQSLMRS